MAQAMRVMNNYFGNTNSFPVKSVPANANLFGLVIVDRELTRIREHRIPFQYIEQVPNYQKSAQYEDITTIGRFETVSAYSHSMPQEFALTLVYYAEGLDAHQKFDGKKNTWTLEYIEKLTTKIKSLNIPRYTPRYAPPYTVLLNMGAIYIDIPLIVKDISITHEPPFHVQDMRSFQQKITLQCRTSYPLYQALDGRELVLAESSGTIMARKKYQPIRTNLI